MPLRLTLGLLAVALVCSACGFQLRGEASLPPEMAKTQMVVDDEYSTLARRVRVMLEQSGVSFVDGDEATAILEIPTNQVVTDDRMLLPSGRGMAHHWGQVITEGRDDNDSRSF